MSCHSVGWCSCRGLTYSEKENEQSNGVNVLAGCEQLITKNLFHNSVNLMCRL